MEEGKLGDAKYKRLSIQKKTCMKVSRKIYGAVCSRRSSIIKCSKITITKFDENSSSSKCKLVS